jgi:hypothetical protein
MTTLQNSYTVPMTVEEWAQLVGIIPIGYRSCHQKDAVSYFVHGNKGYVADFLPEDRTEIPVSRFLDLLHDRITPWRLDEIGWNFVDCKVSYHEFKPNDKVTLSWSEKNKDAGVAFELDDDATWIYITTFTDLLALIRMLTPPSND